MLALWESLYEKGSHGTLVETQKCDNAVEKSV